MLLCKGQMKNPNCSNQYESLVKLFSVVGSQHLRVRAYSPGTGPFSALHAKTWCADGLVYIGGSLNFSRNAAVNNEEHLVVLKDPGVVKTHQCWFEDLWDKAEVQTVEVVAELLIKQKAQKEAKKGPSRSPSVQRQTSRSSIASVPEDAVVGMDALALVSIAAAAVPVSASPLGSPGRAAPRSPSEVPVRAASGSSP